MESHVLQYGTTSIDIEIKGLDENSYIFYPEAGTTKKIEAKGIEVNKLAEEANTYIGITQRDSNGNVITSSAQTLRRIAPFSMIANSTTELTLMEAIDKKMINTITKDNFGVVVFDSSGNYVEPLDFELIDKGTYFDIEVICGQDYEPKEYSVQKDGDNFGPWTEFSGNTASPVIYGSGTYDVKVRPKDVTIPEVLTHSITIYQ